MNLISMIDSLAPFQFSRAEVLSQSVIQSNLVGEAWLVPDSGEEAHVHLFPVVRGYGMYCSRCRGLYPNEFCEHTAAVFLSAMPWICDPDDDAKSERVIRNNIKELRSMLSKGTEYFGCLYASKELGEIDDRSVCMEFAGVVVGRVFRLLDNIYLEITRCVNSEELRERLFTDVRSAVAADSHVFNPYVPSHWEELEAEGDSALYHNKASQNRMSGTSGEN